MHFAFFPPLCPRSPHVHQRFKLSSFFSTLLIGSVYLAMAFLLFIKEMLLSWDEQGGLLAFQNSILPSKAFKKMGFMNVICGKTAFGSQTRV